MHQNAKLHITLLESGNADSLAAGFVVETRKKSRDAE